MVAMKGAELFRCGRWRGKDFTETHLDEIVNNFNRFQMPGPNRLHRVAMVKGHRPEDLHDSSIPKHGTLNRLYREGQVLKYDAENVDPVLAQEIADGKFDDLSAEIYDAPPEGVPGTGKMLRRVAILGGDVPKVKGLNPAGLGPTIQYSERPTIQVTRYSNRRGVYETFSEQVPMGRDEMLSKLVEMGMSQDVLNTLDDVQLTEIIKTGMGQGSATLESTPGKGQPTGDQTVPDQPKDDTKDSKEEKPVVAKTDDDDDIGDNKDAAAKKYSEMHSRCAKFADNYKKKFGAAVAAFSETAIVAPVATVPAAIVTFSEDQIKAALADVIADGKTKMAEMYSEGKAQIAAELAANQKAIADTKIELKRQRLEMFAEAELRTGRLEPADFDRGKGPNIIDRWMNLDDAVVVHKFTENGSERSLTALDAELRAIRQKPVKYVPTSEKLPSAMLPRVETFAEGSPAARKAAFISFAEAQEDRFRRSETTPKEIIAAWEIAPTEEARRELERELGFAA